MMFYAIISLAASLHSNLVCAKGDENSLSDSLLNLQNELQPFFIANVLGWAFLILIILIGFLIFGFYFCKLAQRHPNNVSNTREMVQMPNSLSRSLSLSMSQSNVISKEQNTEEGTFKHRTDKLFHSSTKFLDQSPISACSNHQGSVSLDEGSHKSGSDEFHSTEAFPQLLLDVCEGDLQRAEAFENYLMRVCSEKSMSEEN